jgi:SAM-dependent methyltransferase
MSATTRSTAGVAHERAPIENYAEAHPQLAERAFTPLLLRELVRETRGGVLVDIGCGEGGTLRALQVQAAGTTLVGCDLSRLRVASAVGQGAVALVADCEMLSVKAASCAAVVCRHVIEHVDDRALLAEIRRVLKRDGILYLETPLRLRFAWYPYRNRNGQWVLDPTHLREYESVAQVERLARDAGLRVLRSETAPLRYPVGHVLARVARVLLRSARTRPSVPRHYVSIPRYREIRLLAVADGTA